MKTYRTIHHIPQNTDLLNIHNLLTGHHIPLQHYLPVVCQLQPIKQLSSSSYITSVTRQ